MAQRLKAAKISTRCLEGLKMPEVPLSHSSFEACTTDFASSVPANRKYVVTGQLLLAAKRERVVLVGQCMLKQNSHADVRFVKRWLGVVWTVESWCEHPGPCGSYSLGVTRTPTRTQLLLLVSGSGCGLQEQAEVCECRPRQN